MSIIIQKRIMICLINSAWSPEYLFETNVLPIKIKSKHIRLRFYRKSHKAFKFPKMTVGREMISMSSERMNHEKKCSRDGVSSSCHSDESSAQVASWHATEALWSLQGRSQVWYTRWNRCHKKCCLHCGLWRLYACGRGEKQNSVYGGSNYVVIGM